MPKVAPLRPISRTSTLRTRQANSIETITELNSPLKIQNPKTTDINFNIITQQSESDKKARLMHKLENIKTRSRQIRLESSNSVKERHGLLLDISNKNSTNNSILYETPKYLNSDVLSQPSTNKPMNIFLRKKKPSLCDSDRHTEVKHFAELINDARIVSTPNNTKMCAVKTRSVIGNTETQKNRNIKVNAFFRKKTSSILNRSNLTDVKNDGVKQIPETTPINNNTTTDLPPNIFRFKVDISKRKQIPDFNITSENEKRNTKFKSITEYISEYRSGCERSKITSLSKSLKSKRRTGVFSDTSYLEQFETHQFKKESLLYENTLDRKIEIDKLIGKTHQGLKKIIMGEEVKNDSIIDDKYDDFHQLFFNKRTRRSNKPLRKYTDNNHLTKDDSVPEAKAIRVNEALIELSKQVEMPSVINVKPSTAKFTLQIDIGQCSQPKNSTVYKDDLDSDYFISEMIWYSEKSNIKGFCFIYSHRYDNIKKQGVLHGYKTNTHTNLTLDKSDQLSTIYYYSENIEVKSLKLVTIKNEILSVGIPFEELPDLDFIQSVEIDLRKKMTQVVSHFCCTRKNLIKLQIALY